MADLPSAPSGSVVGIFARANHPVGWGYPGQERGDFGRAHGYVMLLVKCSDEDELYEIATLLQHPGFDGLDAPTYAQGALKKWFGGTFELVTVARDIDWPKHRFQCRGDNRMVAHYTADEVLGALNA